MDNRGPLHLPIGPKKKFSQELENDMATYVDFTWEIGIPRTEKMFAQELVHFMEYKGLKNTFPNIRPGKPYLFKVMLKKNAF